MWKAFILITVEGKHPTERRAGGDHLLRQLCVSWGAHPSRVRSNGWSYSNPVSAVGVFLANWEEEFYWTNYLWQIWTFPWLFAKFEMRCQYIFFRTIAFIQILRVACKFKPSGTCTNQSNLPSLSQVPLQSVGPCQSIAPSGPDPVRQELDDAALRREQRR
jgi:hypothetical protein